MKGANISNSDWNDVEANKLPETVEEMKINEELPKTEGRKRLVVVGLGMVGVAFMCVPVQVEIQY
jgi:nitrite reductase (NAD(P)H)